METKLTHSFLFFIIFAADDHGVTTKNLENFTSTFPVALCFFKTHAVYNN
jgi:hypothetical protein